jgi:putative ABC transport system substrate-binding protein
MRRREFTTLLGSGAAAAWSLTARAQQSDRLRRIGVLMGYPEDDSEARAYIAAFRDGLHQRGWTEGRNSRIDTRWVKPSDAGSMQRFAKELVTLEPEVILSHTTPTTAALLQQTHTIPIVFALVSDPRSSRASRDLVATSPVSTFRSLRRLVSGWNCSRRLRRASPGSRCCSTQHRRHMPNFG